MDGQLVGDIVAAAGGLDGVDVADHVGDGDIRRGQFFDIAMVGRKPGDGSFPGLLRNQVPAPAADGPIRVVVNLAASHVGHGGIEQRGQQAHQARLGLSRAVPEE